MKLRFVDDRLELYEGDNSFNVDFLSSKNLYRFKRGFSKQDPLARAFQKSNKILDATLGWGKDCFYLAGLGAEVTGIEKSEIIFELTHDGFRRFFNSQLLSLKGSVQVLCGNARDYFDPTFDAVYLDPMFPDLKKTALSSKEIQLLQRLVPKNTGDELIELALKSEIKKVVVKRPRSSPELSWPPRHTVYGSLVRYDVFIKN